MNGESVRSDRHMKIVDIRGQEYTQWDYDWYIEQALELAPESWTYEEVVSLRDAIRENYNHGWNIPVEVLAGDSNLLKQFILCIIGVDPYATIRFAPNVERPLPFEPTSEDQL